MELRILLAYNLLIASVLTLNAQSVKIYRENKMEFDSTFYYGVSNLLNIEILNSQGHKLLTNNSNLKVSQDSGTVIPLTKTGHFACFPSKIAFTYLNIFWQGELIRKIKVKILTIPPAKVYLTTDNLKGSPLNISKPIPPCQMLRFVVEPNDHYKSSVHRCFGRVWYIKIVQKRMNRIVSHKEDYIQTVDLKHFRVRSGDNFIIEVTYDQRSGSACDPDFIGNERFSFFVP